MNHHHHDIDGRVVWHMHTRVMHDEHGQHEGNPDLGPSHDDHDHPGQ